MLHRVVLSNNHVLLVEERDGELHIGSETEGGFHGDIDAYICTIQSEGVLVLPNSGDATSYLTRNLQRNPAHGEDRYEDGPAQEG